MLHYASYYHGYQVKFSVWVCSLVLNNRLTNRTKLYCRVYHQIITFFICFSVSRGTGLPIWNTVLGPKTCKKKFDKFLRRSLTENIYSIYMTIIDQDKMIAQLSILKVIDAVTQLLASSNSSMNPFIYGKIKAGITTNVWQCFLLNFFFNFC